MAESCEESIKYCSQRMAKIMLPRHVEFGEEPARTGIHRVRKGVLGREGVGTHT